MDKKNELAKYCPECGNKLEDSPKFCPECGKELKEEQSKKQNEGRKYSILGIVFAFCSLIVFPIIFGPLAVIFGTIAVLKDDKELGIVAIILGVILATISFLIGLYLWLGIIK